MQGTANKKITIKKRFQWFQKDDIAWLGILEITGNYEMETYRVKIETETQHNIKYSHYKFQRFDYKIRDWIIGFTKSHYPVHVFIAIKNAYMEHIKENNVENVLITFKKKDKKRMKINRYFCHKLKDMGYHYLENEQPSYFALFCFKNSKLIEIEQTNMIDEYMNKIFSQFNLDT